MRYLQAGSGHPLVLVHGLLGYSFSWRHAIPVLSQQAHVFAVDMLGAGFSDRSNGLDCCLRASAERLLCFLDKMGLASCDILGTSHGGGVAMMAAALAPDRVRRLVLVDPINPWSAHGRILTTFLSNSFIAPIFLWLASRVRILDEFYFRRLYGDTRRIRPGTLQGYRQALQLPGAFEYGVSVLRSWNRDLNQLESVLPRIDRIPTLLIWGSLDAAVHPRSALQLKRRLTNSKLLVFEGVGHLPYEEVPEEFNRVVTEFLRLSPGQDTPAQSPMRQITSQPK